MKVVVIDYGIGNIQSIMNAFRQFEHVHVIESDDESVILDADAIVLPGVGAFKNAIEELEKRNLPAVLEEYVCQNKPLLGICLGMQLLFESSEEFGYTKGLGFIKGSVNRFPGTTNGKLPHVSWNSIQTGSVSCDGALFRGIKDEDDFYFVHSYICNPERKDIITSITNYGDVGFCSSVQQNNIYACQFHPEKSSTNGLAVIKNFIKVATENV